MMDNPEAVPNGYIAGEKPPLEEAASTTQAPNGTDAKDPSHLHTNSQLQPEALTSASGNAVAAEEEEWKAPADGPLKTPITKPLSWCKPNTETKLTAEQETKYSTVLAAVSQWESIPSTTAKNAPQSPIQEHERMFLTRECLLRYLRATKWKPVDALRRLQSTLSWRREYGADTFTHDYIGPENETGKQLPLGFDNDARPVLYLLTAKQNTKMSDRQIHHLCYTLDRVIDLMPAGVENSALVIDFKGAAAGNIPSVGQARAVLNILQNHNPERLGKALIRETPWYVNTFFRLISSFIDPVTREKMKFNEDLRKYIPPAQLLEQHQGELKFEYDHSIYWPALYEECKTRRDAYRERWEKGGKKIGEYETYLRGGNHPCLQDTAGSAQAESTADPEVVAEVSKLSLQS